MKVGIGLAIWGVAVAWGASADEMVLVDETTPPAPIWAEAAVADHAQGLARYLKQISGHPFSVTVTNAFPETRGIVVSRLDPIESEGLKGDSFLIVCSTNRLRIAGTTAAATGFGVYGFLEEMLGCRWWSVDEEDVPSQPVLRVPVTNRLVAAIFTQTILMNREAQNRLNAFEYKCRTRSTEVWSGSHTLYPLLTPYAQTNREFYPYDAKTGQRAPNNLHFCYSAPGMAEALAEALAKEIERRKGNTRDVIYMAGMGDWYGGGCECPRCQAINLEEGWTAAEGKRHPIMGGTNLRMINRTAEILEARYPGVKVGFMAYMSMEAPPTMTVPRSNVYVRIPHLRHCIVHGVRQCEKNKAYDRNLRRWIELAPGRVHVWDYGVNFGDNFMFPFPVLLSIADNIRYYAALGVGGVLIQGNYVSTGSDLVVLKNYVWRRLLWDPTLDPLDLTKTFCEGYYGPAATPLLNYVLDLERSVDPIVWTNRHLDEFVKRDGMRRSYLTPEREARARALLEEARRCAAGQEPFARRVEEAAASLEAFALWHPGPFQEKEDRLVRADLGDAYTYDRAVHASRYSRQASAREWGPYLGYQLNFLALQGGPLARLTWSDCEATVAPALGMRIRQLRWRGQPLLHVPNDPQAKGWPNLGGLYEQVHPAWISGIWESIPSTTAAVMRADALSKGTARQSDQKRVHFDPDGTLRIEVRGRQVARSADDENTRATLVAEYQTARDESWRVDLLTGPDRWESLTSRRTLEALRTGVATSEWTMAGREAPVEGFRVVLPKRGCVVVDQCLRPPLVKGRVEYHAASGVIKTFMQTGPHVLESKNESLWLERTLKIRPEMEEKP